MFNEELGKIMEDKNLTFVRLIKHEEADTYPCFDFHYLINGYEAYVSVAIFKNHSPVKSWITYELPSEIEKHSYESIKYERLLSKKCRLFCKQLKKTTNLNVKVNPYHKRQGGIYLQSLLFKFFEIQDHKNSIKRAKKREEVFQSFKEWANGIKDKMNPITVDDMKKHSGFKENEIYDSLYLACKNDFVTEEITDNGRKYYIN